MKNQTAFLERIDFKIKIKKYRFFPERKREKENIEY